jgi:uncharacterized protein YkwD
MTRRPKLIAALVLLAGIGPFGRAAFAAAAADSTTAAAQPAAAVESATDAAAAGTPAPLPAAQPAPVPTTAPAPVADTPAPSPAPAAEPQPVAPAADDSAADDAAADEQPVAPVAVESATTSAAVPTSPAAGADIAYGGAAAEFLAATNASRAAVGAGALSPNAALTAYAVQHAATMAESGNLHHSDISVLVGAWSTVGENVGVGPSVGAIHAALLASPGHYRNLADAGFTHVGIGVYTDAGGRTWTAHVFGV